MENKYLKRKLSGINYLLGERYKEPTVSSLNALCKPSICKDCKDKCCRFPCSFAPTDFLCPGEDTFKALLRVGPIVISKNIIKDLGPFYSLRPMSRGDEGRIVSNTIASYNNPASSCLLINWKSGCMLPKEYRPTGGLLLLPSEEHKCVGFFPVSEEYYAWLNYQELLKKLAHQFKNDRFYDEVRGDHIKEIQKIMRRKI